VKGEYNNKCLTFTTSTETRFALGGIAQSGNSGWQNELGELFDIPPLPTECSRVFYDLESKKQVNMRRPERKKRLEVS
jgi:hypothetical protein